MTPVTEQTAIAIQALLTSLRVSRPCVCDKIALAVGGDEFNGNSRLIWIEFHKDSSDPFGNWCITKDWAQY